MTQAKQKTKKISRRDAIKLLGAVTGATVLANLPSKWSTPEIARGVLPAHAQTSGYTISFMRHGNFEYSCGQEPICDQGLSHSVQISPVAMFIEMRWTLTEVAGTFTFSPATGTSTTNPLGVALIGPVVYTPPADGGIYRITSEFVNPSDGTDTCYLDFHASNSSACGT